MLVVVVATGALNDNNEGTNSCAVADSLHWDVSFGIIYSYWIII